MNHILKKFPTILELKKLIMHTSETVWKREITEKEIDRWLNNFIGEVLTKDEEHVLALWLLANFVYYNEDEVRHLCRVLMKDFMHKMLIDLNTQQDEINGNVSKIISKTRFLSLGKPSESGGYILYYYRQANDLHISCFNPPQLSDHSSIDNIIFIDDVTLTAGASGQAYNQLKYCTEMYKNKNIILLTLIASEDSIMKLRSIGVEVITTITLVST